jgi:CBS domain containing-hemolysin-like protein
MDEIIINNLKFTILEIDTNRIIKVKLEKIKAA